MAKIHIKKYASITVALVVMVSMAIPMILVNPYETSTAVSDEEQETDILMGFGQMVYSEHLANHAEISVSATPVEVDIFDMSDSANATINENIGGFPAILSEEDGYIE